MDEKVLARVRKLLAKAEANGVTDAERDALTGKAAEMMAAYGIDEAMAAVRDPARDQVADKRITLDPPFAESKSELFWAVANPSRCTAIRIEQELHDGKNRYLYTMHVFGFRADIERVELLYTSLLLQAANGMKNVTVPPGRQAAAYRDSWLSGFAGAVYWRLLEAERRAAGEAQAGRDGSGPSVALVLADRSSLVAAAARAAHRDTRNSRARKLSGGGEGAGYQAGQRADLGTARNVGRGRGELAV